MSRVVLGRFALFCDVAWPRPGPGEPKSHLWAIRKVLVAVLLNCLRMHVPDCGPAIDDGSRCLASVAWRGVGFYGAMTKRR